MRLRLYCPNCVKERMEWTPVSGGVKCAKCGQFVDGRDLEGNEAARLRFAVIRRFSEMVKGLGKVCA